LSCFVKNRNWQGVAFARVIQRIALLIQWGDFNSCSGLAPKRFWKLRVK
jgi:hypothetical protein